MSREPSATLRNGAGQLGTEAARSLHRRIGSRDQAVEPHRPVVGGEPADIVARQDLQARRRLRLAVEPVGGDAHDAVARRDVVRLQPAELDVVHAGIGAVDHHVVAVGDLVDEADADHLAHQRLPARAAIEQGIAGGAAIEAGFGQRPLHHLDLVGALAEPAQLAIEVGIELPHAGPTLLRQPHALQGLEAPDPQGMPAMIGLRRQP